MMAKTSAERQADLRARRANEQRQLNAWISAAAYLSIRRRAERDNLTIGEVLEHMLTEQGLKKREKAHKGLTQRQYKLLRAAVHPDKTQDPDLKRDYGELFRFVGELNRS